MVDAFTDEEEACAIVLFGVRLVEWTEVVEVVLLAKVVGLSGIRV